MKSIDLLGYTASVASGGAFLPQAVRALRTRQTRDLSLLAVALGAAGTVLWSAYGVAIGSGPVMISNLIVMPFALATLGMKLRGG
jgi:MtN3 and saliva related transmembrane protein